jgi:hypothetical protein
MSEPTLKATVDEEGRGRELEGATGPATNQQASHPEKEVNLGKIFGSALQEKEVNLGEAFGGVVHPNSQAWADIVRWVSAFVLGTVGLVIILPLAAIIWGVDGLPASQRIDSLFTWANTALPAVVGLGSL